MKTSRLGKAALIVASVLALGISTAGVHAAVVIQNGSFESQILANDSLLAGNGGDDWIGSTGASQAILFSENYAGFGTTPFGRQYVGLTYNGTNEQTVTGFVAGQDYVFSVYAADVNNDPTPELTISLSGAFTGSTAFILPVSGPMGAADYPFVEKQVFFTPLTSGSITFTLKSTGLNSSVAIDNVTVIEVPEPSSCALLGLGVIGLLARRRKTGAAA